MNDTLTLDQVRLRLDALNDEYAADPAFERVRAEATRLVPGFGASRPLVMFIGEAPGGEEDRLGRPFVGAAGQFLDGHLARIGLDRTGRCYTTNVLKYRPRENRDPTMVEVQRSRPYLWREVDILSPGLVVTLGRFSCMALWPRMTRITECAGKLRHDAEHGIWHLPLLHPSYGLRPENTAAFEANVAALASVLGDIR